MTHYSLCSFIVLVVNVNNDSLYIMEAKKNNTPIDGKIINAIAGSNSTEEILIVITTNTKYARNDSIDIILNVHKTIKCLLLLV